MNNITTKIIILITIAAGLISAGYFLFFNKQGTKLVTNATETQSIVSNPLQISAMRQKDYPGSNINIEQTLSPGSNYNQYIVSYLSDGLKIYALLTVPIGEVPTNGWPASNASQSDAGWPVIIFNHGYIPPTQYQTTERYVAYVDALAKSGYIVFKPDYRGNGNSEGQPEGAYYSPAYAIDVLHAVSSIKKFPAADPNRIGMWGHSMGGNITLRDLVVKPQDIKAAVIWGGVVGSYNDLINNWQRRVSYQPPPQELRLRNNGRQNLISLYGTPENNPNFWQSIDPTYFLADINTPIQLHTGGNDEEVPIMFSQSLFDKLQAAGKIVEYFNYPGGDHNISSPDFELPMKSTF